MTMLSVRDLHVAYGQIEALHGIELDVEKGEIVTLIGANGAGKTTTLRTISGLLKPRSGSVTFNAKSITGVKPHVITAMGISHVQVRFASRSADELCDQVTQFGEEIGPHLTRVALC